MTTVTPVVRHTAQLNSSILSLQFLGATPIMKDSEHFFFDLPQFESMLKSGLVLALFKLKLQTRCKKVVLNLVCNNGISHVMRLTLVFEIPGEKQVLLRLARRANWLHGFIQNLCNKRDDLDFDEYWNKDS